MENYSFGRVLVFALAWTQSIMVLPEAGRARSKPHLWSKKLPNDVMEKYRFRWGMESAPAWTWSIMAL